MNIPELPTDNLYKFLAIFGLIIICFASYYDYNNIQKGKQFLVEHQAKILVLSKKLELLGRDNIFLSSIYLELSLSNKVYNTDKTDTIQFTTVSPLLYKYKQFDYENNPKMNFVLQCLYDQTSLLDSLSIEYAYENMVIDVGSIRNGIGWPAIIFYLIMTIAGIVLCLAGFINWYYKHQIYLDAYIKQQSIIRKTDKEQVS